MKASAILLVVGGLILTIALIVGSMVSANNTANRFEQGIKASHESGRNTLGQYAPQLREALGVTKIQAGAVEDIITGANESRYGESGSAATVQWISEQNPNLDQSNYGKVINLVEAGRRDFRVKQDEKIDRIRAYNTALGNFPGGSMMKFMGWPTPGFIEKYEKLVVSGHANDSFETGIDDGVNLNGI